MTAQNTQNPSMIGSVMQRIFGAAPQTAPVAHVPATQSQQPLQDSTASAGANTTVPSASTPRSDGSLKSIPAAGEGEKDPLAEYASLWEAPVVNPDAPPAPTLAPKFTVDPKKMMEAAGKIDFQKAIPAEMITKIKAGDQDALMGAMNQVAQATYAQAAIATTKIVENALTRQQQAFEQLMPEILRRHNVSNAVREDNPLFDSPAVAPLLQSVEQQFATKFPSASPAEITAKAKDYLNSFATAVLTNAGKMVTDPAPTKPGAKRKDTDWSTFLG